MVKTLMQLVKVETPSYRNQSESTSILKNQERMKSSVTMQAYTQMPPAGLQLHAPQQTSCSSVPTHTIQMQNYIPWQRMTNEENKQRQELWNSQSSSQPVSNSSNVQLRQMPQTWCTESQNQLLLRHSTSMRATLPNGQFKPLVAAQHGTPKQTLSYHPQTLNRNTSIQQNYNMLPLNSVSSATVCWIPSVNSNAGYATEQNNLTHETVLSQHQSSNGHHNSIQYAQHPTAQLQQTDLSVLTNQADQKIHNNQGCIRERKGNGALYSPAHNFPGSSQRLITPSQPSSHQTSQSHTSSDVNQVQYSSQIQHQPSPYNAENNSTCYSHLKHSRNKHQSSPSNLRHPPSYTSKHFIIQSQSNQKMNQSSALRLSQDNVQPQTPMQQCHTVPGFVVQLNNPVTGLSRSSQIPSTTPTSEALSPVCTESALNYYSPVTLVGDNTQVSAQRHDISPKDSFTTQGQTPSHITTKENYSQIPQSAPNSGAPATIDSKEHDRVIKYQTSVQRTPILKENNKDVVKPLDLIMAMQKVFQQFHKAVAVVPPISQQVPSPEKNDHVITSSDYCLPFKISCTLVKESKDMNQESNASSLPKETMDHFPVPHPDEQEINKHEDGSTVNSLTPDTQRADIHQSKTDSTTSQGHICGTALTSKCQEDHNKVDTAKLNDNIFDLSKVQVRNFTLQQFIYWVKLLESSPERTVKEPVPDVEKCLIDLYWDGMKENVVKQIRSFRAHLYELFSELSIENMHTAVFQYLRSEDFEMLADGGHILKNDANLPTEEFKSSWLNIDEQPADIENILAEPILDFKLPDNALYSGFDTFDIYSKSDPSTKVIPETTNYQSDTMINKELVNSKACESKSNDKVSKTQEPSKKQEDENLEKHQQQDVNLNPEQSVSDSNEMTDKLTENKNKTECEQVCRDASEDITSSLEIVEQSDHSNDLDTSNDSQIIKFSLLSADDARMIFKEYLQKEPAQLCQDGITVSDSESNDFCNSSKQIKFTCPHVTDIDIDWDGEHFCPMCLEETPLLDLDLDEALFSPIVGSPDIIPLKQGHYSQSCSPQSGNTDSNYTQLSESSSIADSPSPDVEVFEVTFSEPDTNPSDTVESGTSLSGNSPVKEPHVPMCTQSVSFTMPIEKQVYETSTSAGPELPKALFYAQNIENLVFSEQTKTPRHEVSPPRKKLIVTKTTEMPLVLGKTKGSGQSQAMKKIKLTLYGFNDGNQDRTVRHKFYKKTNSSSVPVHVTISKTPEAAISYTDASSAKQKVYSQWSSTFVEPKKKTSSRKKHQKHEQAELKSKTQALKRHLEDRIAINEKQMCEA